MGVGFITGQRKKKDTSFHTQTKGEEMLDVWIPLSQALITEKGFVDTIVAKVDLDRLAHVVQNIQNSSRFLCCATVDVDGGDEGGELIAVVRPDQAVGLRMRGVLAVIWSLPPIPFAFIPLPHPTTGFIIELYKKHDPIQESKGELLQFDIAKATSPRLIESYVNMLFTMDKHGLMCGHAARTILYSAKDDSIHFDHRFCPVPRTHERAALYDLVFPLVSVDVDQTKPPSSFTSQEIVELLPMQRMLAFNKDINTKITRLTPAALMSLGLMLQMIDARAAIPCFDPSRLPHFYCLFILCMDQETQSVEVALAACLLLCSSSTHTSYPSPSPALL